MSQTATRSATSFYNLPNKLTSLRLVLSFVLFFTIWLGYWLTSFGVFVIASLTDWLDGYYARKMGLASSLGRVYDPLVDKVLVCGAFIFLMDVRDSALAGGAGLNAWMVTIIVAREFLVTGIRGFLEKKGIAFGADYLGKIKMAAQCAAIFWILFALGLAEHGYVAHWIAMLRDVLNWSTVLLTFVSGANYVRQAFVHLD